MEVSEKKNMEGPGKQGRTRQTWKGRKNKEGLSKQGRIELKLWGLGKSIGIKQKEKKGFYWHILTRSKEGK